LSRSVDSDGEQCDEEAMKSKGVTDLAGDGGGGLFSLSLLRKAHIAEYKLLSWRLLHQDRVNTKTGLVI
jgi:hypothetical protein